MSLSTRAFAALPVADGGRAPRREGGKPEWLTLSRAPARLPERQADLFTSAPAAEPSAARRTGG